MFGGVKCNMSVQMNESGAPEIVAGAMITREIDEKNHRLDASKIPFWVRWRKKLRMNKNRIGGHVNSHLENNKDINQQQEKIHNEYLTMPCHEQYASKMDLERKLQDEGFFDNPQDNLMAETIFVSYFTDCINFIVTNLIFS